MIEKVITVTAENGMHAYPASLLAQCLQKFDSDVSITKDNRVINAKSTLKLMTMNAVTGTKLKFSFNGVDEEDAMKAVVHLFETNFEVVDEE